MITFYEINQLIYYPHLDCKLQTKLVTCKSVSLSQYLPRDLSISVWAWHIFVFLLQWINLSSYCTDYIKQAFTNLSLPTSQLTPPSPSPFLGKPWLTCFHILSVSVWAWHISCVLVPGRWSVPAMHWQSQNKPLHHLLGLVAVHLAHPGIPTGLHMHLKPKKYQEWLKFLNKLSTQTS